MSNFQIDPVYINGWVAYNRASNFPNINTLASVQGDFFNVYHNLRNHLEKIADGTYVNADGSIRSDLVPSIVSWTQQLNAYNAPASTVDTRPAIERDPASAEFVRGLYTRYFGRSPDTSGWNFWTLELINNRKTRADVETAFYNDAEAATYRATQRQPPQPGYTVPPVATAPGSGVLDGEIFGISKKLLLVGVAGYFLLTSGGKK